MFSHDDSVSCTFMRMHRAQRQLEWLTRPRVVGGAEPRSSGHIFKADGHGMYISQAQAGPESRGESSIGPLGFENMSDGIWACVLDIARILGRRSVRSYRPFARAEFIRASGHGRVAALPRARSSGFASRSSRGAGRCPADRSRLRGPPAEGDVVAVCLVNAGR